MLLKADISYHKKDLIAQVSYFPMLFFYFSCIFLYLFDNESYLIFRTLLIALFFQLVTGIVQVISALLHLIRFKSNLHKFYLIYAFVYFLILFLTYGAIKGNWGFTYLVIFIAIIPLLSSSWYYLKTGQLFMNAQQDKSNTHWDENLLDDMF